MNTKLVLLFLAFAATSISSPTHFALAADGDDQKCGIEMTKFARNQLTFDKELFFEYDSCVVFGLIIDKNSNKRILYSEKCNSSPRKEARWSNVDADGYHIVTGELSGQLVLSCLDWSTTSRTEDCIIGYLDADAVPDKEILFSITVYKRQWKRSIKSGNDMVYFSVNSIWRPDLCITRGEPEVMLNSVVWVFHLASCLGNANQTFFVKNTPLIDNGKFPDC